MPQGVGFVAGEELRSFLFAQERAVGFGGDGRDFEVD